MRKLTIVLLSINAVGHLNAALGATRALVERGHRLIFVYEKAFSGKAIPYGIEEHIYSVKTPEEEAQEEAEAKKYKPGELAAKLLLESKVIGPFSAEEKSANMFKFLISEMNVREFAALNQATIEAIELFKPDLLYYDNVCTIPAVYYAAIPWVRQNSVTPIFFEVSEDLPPGGSGLPYNGDRTKWAEFNKIRPEAHGSKLFQDIQIKPLGYEPYPDNLVMPANQILTVYAYPEELDYPEIRAKGTEWINLECFQRNSQELSKLQDLVPSTFLDDNLDGKFSGKLIYLSMGSMGSVDLDLMNRLVKLLGSTNHKYIVSKGPRHEELVLAGNMWGERYLPQVKLLPHVDLVITHGGNNTVTEVFAEGKPMIVLPLFVDQFDNAQRLHETGFGARLDTYGFSDKELIDTVDKLLYDEQLNERLHSASVRIRQSSDKHVELAVRIEQLVAKIHQ